MGLCNHLHILGSGLVLFDAGREGISWSATALDRVDHLDRGKSVNTMSGPVSSTASSVGWGVWSKRGLLH